MTAPESEGSTYEKYWPSDGISVSEDITSNEREPKLHNGTFENKLETYFFSKQKQLESPSYPK